MDARIIVVRMLIDTFVENSAKIIEILGPVRELELDCMEDHLTPKNRESFRGNISFHEEMIGGK